LSLHHSSIKPFEEDTTWCETPGRIYTLARTFILHGRKRALWVFHNLLNSWLAGEEELHRNAPAWDRMGGLLIIIDGDLLIRPRSTVGDQPAEYYSRILRDIEKLCLLGPDAFLPMRVAVVVGCSTREKMSELLAGNLRGKGETVQDAVMSHDPALHSLLIRTTKPRKLKFWGWVATRGGDQVEPSIAHEVGVWIMAK
jgi:hypothetical protein